MIWNGDVSKSVDIEAWEKEKCKRGAHYTTFYDLVTLQSDPRKDEHVECVKALRNACQETCQVIRMRHATK